MALRIVRSSDPIQIDRLNLCIYAAPGLGKTSISFTADKPLLFDFDRGAHRAANRKDSVPVNAWEDVANVTAADLADFNTIVVDTAGRALDVLSADIIRRNAKMGRGGALTLQGYGQLKVEFVAWLKLLNSFGKDVILIAHMDEQRNGDEIIERLDVQGGSKGEIYKAADAMARLSIRDGKRILNFSPTDAAFGKNPGQLEPLEVPRPDLAPTFLADVMQQIKDRLNALTEEQREAQAVLETWRLAIADVEDVEGFNRLIPDVKKAPMAVQALLSHTAKARGYTFDAKTKQYVAPSTEKAA